MNNFVYLSHFFSKNTPTFGNDDKIEINTKTKISKGDVVNMYSLFLSNNHIGTHIDLPKHFYDSEKGVEYYNPKAWIFGNIKLIDIPRNNSDLITSSDFLDKNNKNVELILIRTGYQKYRNTDKYWNDNPGLAADLGDYLRSNYPNLRAVGFDFISLTSWKHKEEGIKAHLNFLDPSKGEILIIEDMKLSDVNDDEISEVVVSPWLIEELDSAPVTIIAKINS